jgi:hypothetical protein
MRFKTNIFPILLLCSLTISAQNLQMNGPTAVCPGTTPSGPTYTFNANTLIPGCFEWQVYEDGLWNTLVSPTCSGCSTNSTTSSSFNYQFNNSSSFR